MIHLLFQISEQDKFSQRICQECLGKLKSFLEFRETIHRSDKLLHELKTKSFPDDSSNEHLLSNDREINSSMFYYILHLHRIIRFNFICHSKKKIRMMLQTLN